MTKKLFIQGEEINTLSVIPTIDPPLERFRNKTIIVTGDSITARDYTSVIWADHIKSWLYFLKVWNDAISGTGLSKNVGSNKCIYDRIDDWDTNYTATPDYVFVMLSINDVGFNGLQTGTTADITSENPTFHTSYYMNVRMLIEKLQAKYHTIPIGIITSIPWSTHYGRNDTYYAWNEATKEVCKHFSVPCLDLFTQSGHRPWDADFRTVFNADGTHPNNAGQKQMAYKIYEFIKQYL